MPSFPLELREISARYRDVVALRDLTLSVGAGELLAVVGPSGCGKTTLLRCLAGFVSLAGGSIRLGDQTIAGEQFSLPPERRGIGLVFQNYALWPHMTALENVAYPWRIRGVGRQERQRRAASLLAELGLAGLERRRPAELSGGQQQRVALARALACEPRLLLLDEPLSNVDGNLRESLQDLILNVVRQNALTTILATHDLEEAFALADRVAILRDGTLVQAGTPEDVSARPVSGFVARFLGGMNVVPVEIAGTGNGRTTLRFATGETIEVDADAPPAPSALLCVRPEQVGLGTGDAGLPGIVSRATRRGAQTEYRLTAGGIELRAIETGSPARVAGDRAAVTLGEVLLLPPED